MELTTKRIEALKSQAQTLKPMFQIGKEGLTPAVIVQVMNYLAKHELGKLAVLPTSPLRPEAAGEQLAALGISLIQIIGSNIVIYKPNPELKSKGRVRR